MSSASSDGSPPRKKLPTREKVDLNGVFVGLRARARASGLVLPVRVRREEGAVLEQLVEQTGSISLDQRELDAITPPPSDFNDIYGPFQLDDDHGPNEEPQSEREEEQSRGNGARAGRVLDHVETAEWAARVLSPLVRGVDSHRQSTSRRVAEPWEMISEGMGILEGDSATGIARLRIERLTKADRAVKERAARAARRRDSPVEHQTRKGFSQARQRMIVPSFTSSDSDAPPSTTSRFLRKKPIPRPSKKLRLAPIFRKSPNSDSDDDEFVAPYLPRVPHFPMLDLASRSQLGEEATTFYERKISRKIKMIDLRTTASTGWLGAIEDTAFAPKVDKGKGRAATEEDGVDVPAPEPTQMRITARIPPADQAMVETRGASPERQERRTKTRVRGNRPTLDLGPAVEVTQGGGLGLPGGTLLENPVFPLPRKKPVQPSRKPRWTTRKSIATPAVQEERSAQLTHRHAPSSPPSHDIATRVVQEMPSRSLSAQQMIEEDTVELDPRQAFIRRQPTPATTFKFTTNPARRHPPPLSFVSHYDEEAMEMQVPETPAGELHLIPAGQYHQQMELERDQVAREGTSNCPFPSPEHDSDVNESEAPRGDPHRPTSLGRTTSIIRSNRHTPRRPGIGKRRVTFSSPQEIISETPIAPITTPVRRTIEESQLGTSKSPKRPVLLRRLSIAPFVHPTWEKEVQDHGDDIHPSSQSYDEGFAPAPPKRINSDVSRKNSRIEMPVYSMLERRDSFKVLEDQTSGDEAPGLELEDKENVSTARRAGEVEGGEELMDGVSR